MLFCLMCSVQKANAQRVGLGAAAGFNVTTHTQTFQFESSSAILEMNLEPMYRSGYQYGAVLRRRLSRNFRIQLEPMFSSVGALYDGFFNFAGNKMQIDGISEIHYFHLPVLIQLTTTPPDLAEFPRPWPEFTFHLSAGGYAGYLIDAAFSGNVSGTPLGVEFSGSFANNTKSQFADYDAGLVIGAGSEFGLNTKLGIEMRLMYGFLNAVDSTDEDFQINHIVFSTSVYFLF